MRLTDLEIERRKALLEFRESDVQLLLSCRPFIFSSVDTLVREFYEKQTAFEENALLIGDAETLQRLMNAQRQYVLDLFDGHYGVDYVNSRLRIGLVHKRIGVEPKLYLSAVRILKSILEHTIRARIADPDRVFDAMSALEKLMNFDTTLVFDTYIRGLLSEIDLSRSRVEEYAQSLELKVTARTAELEELARRDSLTGLYNRRAMMEFLWRDLRYMARHGKPLSLVYLDVDEFKHINDTHGHRRGDEILLAVASSMLAVIRDSDTACRHGGDEFCIVLPDCTVDDAERTCARLRENLRKLEPQARLSFGIAQSGPSTFDDADTLIRRADEKMYESKNRDAKAVPLAVEMPADPGHSEIESDQDPADAA
jgi:diguanylate cyclase (GGDEF)-like protein